jgi:hypothetical protein
LKEWRKATNANEGQAILRLELHPMAGAGRRWGRGGLKEWRKATNANEGQAILRLEC